MVVLAAADLGLPVGSQTDNPSGSINRSMPRRGSAGGVVAADERPRRRLTTWVQPTQAFARRTAQRRACSSASADLSQIGTFR